MSGYTSLVHFIICSFHLLIQLHSIVYRAHVIMLSSENCSICDIKRHQQCKCILKCIVIVYF